MFQSVKYAKQGTSGTYASKIGWIDYGNAFFLSSGETKKIMNIIQNQYRIQFELSFYSDPVYEDNVIAAYIPPVFQLGTVPFGNTAYRGIDGNVVLYMPNTTPLNVNTVNVLSISNIQVTDSQNQRVTDYEIVAADAETTNKGEIWQAATDGEGWVLIDIMPSSTGKIEFQPTITGIGSSIVTENGTPTVNYPEVAAGVFMTNSPRNVIVSMTTNDSREGVAFGIIVHENSCCQSC